MKQNLLENPELLVAVDVDPDMDYPCSKCVLHRFCKDPMDPPIECMAHKRVDNRSVYFITQENGKERK